MMEVVADDGGREACRVVDEPEWREHRTAGGAAEDLRIGADDQDDDDETEGEGNDQREHCASMVRGSGSFVTFDVTALRRGRQSMAERVIEAGALVCCQFCGVADGLAAPVHALSGTR